jgi:hypothetical protein
MKFKIFTPARKIHSVKHWYFNMGISLRIFIVDDDDTLKRLPLARYDRLLERNSKECMSQYAGKRVRYALVVVNLWNREPVEILRFEYSFLHFHAGGKNRFTSPLTSPLTML